MIHLRLTKDESIACGIPSALHSTHRTADVTCQECLAFVDKLVDQVMTPLPDATDDASVEPAEDTEEHS